MKSNVSHTAEVVETVGNWDGFVWEVELRKMISAFDIDVIQRWVGTVAVMRGVSGNSCDDLK